MNKQSLQKFPDALLAWYDANKRLLPFRLHPDPYHIWVSEIMLQQTRMETVLPYFERFIQAVPSIEALANISDDRLLKLWQGLGYYSRAKNLKKAAVILCEQYGGQLPADINELIKLPGIGPYTAGAIASIAYGKKIAAIDGNVLRVVTRLTANKGDIADKKTIATVEKFVLKNMPEHRCGDFNQAMMELGALICLPNTLPKCSECPLSFCCKAYINNLLDIIPVKTAKPNRKIEKKTVFIFTCKDEYALQKRPASGLLSSLFEFYNIEGHLSEAECKHFFIQQGIQADSIRPLPKAKHIFTHLEWHMQGYHVSLREKPQCETFVWAKKEEIQKIYSIPSAFKTYLQNL